MKKHIISSSLLFFILVFLIQLVVSYPPDLSNKEFFKLLIQAILTTVFYTGMTVYLLKNKNK